MTTDQSRAGPAEPGRAGFIRAKLEAAVLAPVRAFRWRYLPLLMVYFAYGALGLTGIAATFWVKQGTTLTPADLAALGVWLSLPWAIKMVFGELVDAVPVLGSQRRSYVFIGAGLIALSYLMLAGAAGGVLTFASPNTLYVIASIVSVLGVVLQDVVADAMSTEVVDRTSADGSPRPQADVDRDLGMVQVLGRLAVSLGIFAVAGIGGVLASYLPYWVVFLIGLVVPLISITGALMVRLETSETRPIDWKILGGGLAFGAVVVMLGISGIPGRQEVVFLISLAVIVTMLRRVMAELSSETRRGLVMAAVLIFAFRATPAVGDGYTWFSMDKLGFDELFFGLLGQIGAAIGLVSLWLLADFVTRQPIERVMLWLTILGTILFLPSIGLVLGMHEWTQRMLGFGARVIAVLDTAASSPLAQLSMIPLLTLVAVNAPRGHRATWFALMASLMNLALVAGQLGTKYLNQTFAIDRGDYDGLTGLMWVVLVVGLVVPLVAILWLGPRMRAAMQAPQS